MTADWNIAMTTHHRAATGHARIGRVMVLGGLVMVSCRRLVMIGARTTVTVRGAHRAMTNQSHRHNAIGADCDEKRQRK